jgi:NTE family protein
LETAKYDGKTGLVLTGGGARAAYQAGVLVALKELLADHKGNPFPVICGTSAGAINAAALASHCHDFPRAVDELRAVWEGFEPRHVYRADFLGVAANSGRWIYNLVFGAFSKNKRVSLFDNRPLAHMLHKKIDFVGIERAIAHGDLRALSITCSGYTSGQSCSFFEAKEEIPGWKRSQRVGIKCKLTADHLLASSAIPFIFPAVKLNREYFGDGSMRQLAPVSPALHLGAKRILVVATAKIRTTAPDRLRGDSYPSLAEIAGHAMRSIFLDNLALDIELLERINETIAVIPPDALAEAGLKMGHVDVLVLAPSEPLDTVALGYVKNLPWPIRFLMRTIGAMRRGGAHLASYLLFERGYCGHLIDMGYRDTMAAGEMVRAFVAGAYQPLPGTFAQTMKFPAIKTVPPANAAPESAAANRSTNATDA